MEITIKHGGKQLPVQFDPTMSAIDLKKSISEVTGVPLERMKVMVKGGMLKDTAVMSQLGFKPGQQITVIGSSVSLPPAPVDRPTFIEDMDESDIAQQAYEPSGLVNLGQTCYLNSSLQALRQIPQLQVALNEYQSSTRSPEDRFTASVRNLFAGMRQSRDPVPPMMLLNELRTLAPQFAEMDSTGRGFAQQDADEAWTQIISALRTTLGSRSSHGSFIDDYMSAELTKTLQCPEAPDEPVTTTKERVLKLECNINISTNYMTTGILESLDQQIEKTSPSLGRMATYKQLPEFLVVHMVRFYWRRDIQKKAKIMRKVKFPLQLDATELVTDDVRDLTRPVNAVMKNIIQARDDRAKQLKTARDKAEHSAAEVARRAEERSQLEAVVQERGLAVTGNNPSGMYELCAMVTHKGASADSGHYIGWARQEETSYKPVGEEDWYKFDDDKVSVVTADKILAMDGGGQDSVAYILMYRAIRP